MPQPFRRAAALAAAAFITLPAQAASGSIDSFGASATDVVAGSWVDFNLNYSIFTTSNFYGGSNPYEPEPQDGYQEWYVNWAYSESETATSVSLQIGGESTTEFLSAGPGSSTTGSWTASLYFDTPGQYTIAASGAWTGVYDSWFSNESAYRNCYAADPDNGGSLTCDAWTWVYSDGADNYTIGGDFAGQSLTINVTPAVPEPGTLALWLAGAALLGSRRLRRRA